MKILQGDCLERLRELGKNSVDAIVTDPPYELGFMGKAWDASGIANSVPMWRECLRVLKPGGHLLSFGGSRTYHRMASAIEDAGFEIRDQIMWLYGSGFPKSHDVSKQLDKKAGAKREVIERRTDGPSSWMLTQKLEHRASGGTGIGYADGSGKEYDVTAPATDAAKQWQGWGTALKPAHEPICVARKPIEGTVAANVQKWGTGAINIDGCRIPTSDGLNGGRVSTQTEGWDRPWKHDADAIAACRERGAEAVAKAESLGRWPANVIHDDSDEVLDAFPSAPGQQGDLKETGRARPSSGRFGDMGPPHAHKARRDGEPSADRRYTEEGSTNFAALPGQRRFDAGSAARFFYCAKTSKSERGEGNTHPTVKPLALMRYLCRLVTPPSGMILDPFTGSGSTGLAAIQEGFGFIGIEISAEYVVIANARLLAEILA